MTSMLSMLKNVADFVTPVLKESEFAEKGVLTPEEFVAAGDQLVFSCRTWAWASGNPGTQKKYLPHDKQFLITRNVPSLRRAHTYALADAKEEVIRGAGSADMDDGEGWLSTHSAADMEKSRAVHDMDDEANISTTMKQTHLGSSSAAASSSSSSSSAAAVSSSSKPVPAAAPAASNDDDDEIGDIDDIDASPANNLVTPAQPTASKPAAASSTTTAQDEFPDMEAFDEDDNILAPPTQHEEKQAAAASNKPGKTGPYLKTEEPEDNIVKTRTYDISIVYDKYYRTPRVYLFGYDEHRQPLSAEQIMEDISADHANKTVTVESHPFLTISHLSIHPCKHAHVMKRIVDQMSAAKGQQHPSIDVKQYMYIFLKFISSVIPTIEYDYTLSG